MLVDIATRLTARAVLHAAIVSLAPKLMWWLVSDPGALIERTIPIVRCFCSTDGHKRALGASGCMPSGDLCVDIIGGVGRKTWWPRTIYAGRRYSDLVHDMLAWRMMRVIG